MHLELKLESKWADKSCELTSDYVVCETGSGTFLEYLVWFGLLRSEYTYVNIW